MEWSDIRVFLQVAREGAMARAAAALRLNLSTISRRIARLEREAGVPLFDRAGRRLTLTPEGDKLVLAAEKLESIILREVMSLSQQSAEVAGPVRIGVGEEFGVHYLASRLPALMDTHPGLEIELVVTSRQPSLAAREVDVVITPVRPASGDVRSRKLTDIAWGLFGASDYFKHHPPLRHVGDLDGVTWCGSSDRFRWPADAAWALAERDARYRTTHVSAQMEVALNGDALAILPCFMAGRHPSLQRLLANEIGVEQTYWMAVHADMTRYPRVRAVMSALVDQVTHDRRLFLPKPETGAEEATLVDERTQKRPPGG